MTPSVQENLARVRAGLWDHDRDNIRSFSSSLAEEERSWSDDRHDDAYQEQTSGPNSLKARKDDVDHGDILARYDEAIREHERGLKRAWRALDLERGRTSGRSRTTAGYGDNDADSAGAGSRRRRRSRGEREMRFRFKHDPRSSRSSAKAASATSDGGYRVRKDGGRSRRSEHGHRHKHGDARDADEPEEGVKDLSDLTAHPLPRALDDDDVWLDETINSNGQPSATLAEREQMRGQRHHHAGSDSSKYDPWDVDDYQDSASDGTPPPSGESSAAQNRHSRKKRRKHRSRSLHGDHQDPNAESPAGDDERPVTPLAAFRNSLFDALADDEGAAGYWEGVYGQPINIYARTWNRSDDQRHGPHPTGVDPDATHHDGAGATAAADDIQRMNDDEYAAYVMRRMWERANPQVLQQRRERERAAATSASQRQHGQQRSRRGDAGADTDPSRGHGHGFAGQRGSDGGSNTASANPAAEQRKWLALWEGYTARWTELGPSTSVFSRAPEAPTTNTDTTGSASVGGTATPVTATVQDIIPWPTETYKRTGQPDGPRVRAFLAAVCEWVAPVLASSSLPPVSAAAAAQTRGKEAAVDDRVLRTRVSLLKAERFRWHPDKFMQRFGGREALGEDVLAAVTEVFQIVDGMLDDLSRR